MDNTREKQAGTIGTEDETKFHKLVERAQDGILIASDDTIQYVNPSFAKMLNYTVAELTDTPLYDYFEPVEAPKVIGRHKRRMAGKPITPIFETAVMHRNGSKIPVEISGELINHQGRRANLVIIRDITLRKQAEQALLDSKEKYRHLIEAAKDAIFIVQDGIIKFSNTRALKISGYSAEELARTPVSDLIHPKDKKMVLAIYRAGRDEEKFQSTNSFRIINKRGQELCVQIDASTVTWEGESATLIFLRDLTRLKKLESRITAVQKLEATGTLAGGVAHDYNNLLTSILGNAELIMADIESGHPHYNRLKNIKICAQRGSDLTKQLLGFARGGKYEVKTVDLNELVRESSSMFCRTRKEIIIHNDLRINSLPVEVDPVQIEQVLLNLYINAWQAMPDNGDLYIQTEIANIDEHYIKTFQVPPGEYARVSVTDTGIGMDAETRKRIFDPFFTTKEKDRGTGLGLASAYGIVRNHGGFIDVYSEKGKGSTFQIYLPIAKKPVVKEKPSTEKPVPGKGTILIVDDEKMILDVSLEMIQKLGYNTLTAENGLQALEIYRESQAGIDIVILDMTMPGIGGGEAFDRLRAINPEVKIILASGYSINGKVTSILKRGCDAFIQKPYGLNELSRKICEVLSKNTVSGHVVAETARTCISAGERR